MNTKQTHKIKRNFLGILNLGIILLFCVTLLAVSCSKNDADVIEQQQEPPKTTFSQQDNPYKSIMDSLYGKGEYNVHNSIQIDSTGSSFFYDVYEVSLDGKVRGYLVDGFRKKGGDFEGRIFIDHNSDDPNMITYYNLDKEIQRDYDLTFDPNYPDGIAFNPTEPPIKTFGNPFMGTRLEIGKSYDCGAPGQDCICTEYYSVTYFFWIKVGSSYDHTALDCGEAIPVNQNVRYPFP